MVGFKMGREDWGEDCPHTTKGALRGAPAIRRAEPVSVILCLSFASMPQISPEVSKLLEQALALSVEEQEALADSLISNLGGRVDEEVLAAWDEEVKKRIADLDSGKAKTIPWEEVRQRNLAKLPRAR